ncbi:MAG: hypothetical protein AAFN17_00920 [Pseudomonadota bacterium]
MKMLIAAVAAAAVLPMAAHADDDYFGLKLDGSIGEGGFEKYAPPLLNPVFNETPHITTEVKPFIAYHDIPDDFISGGGRVIAVGLQARLAVTERFGLIATLDGYSDLAFDNTLSDDGGFNDLGFGAKYAFLYNPEAGYIATAGLRYTAPVGTLDTNVIGLNGSNIDLNGTGAGYLNPFVTGRYDIDEFGVQASLGGQIALSDENWSFIHASVRADYEVLDGLFPFAAVNIFAPVDGGDSVVNDINLPNLTGADIADVGGSDPRTMVLLGGGARYRVNEHAILGVGVEGNLANREDTIWGWRMIADAVIHF